VNQRGCSRIVIGRDVDEATIFQRGDGETYKNSIVKTIDARVRYLFHHFDSLETRYLFGNMLAYRCGSRSETDSYVLAYAYAPS